MRNTGQATAEIILLSFVLIVIAQVSFNLIKDNDYLTPLTSFTHQSLGNMMASASWKLDQAEARDEHPNHLNRHYSWERRP